MKGLKEIKKITVGVAIASLIMMTSVSAMAATYTTKTTYKSADTIQVDATAAELNENDIVTYVATTNSENINENTIVYLNQKVSDDTGVVRFNYTTSITNIDAVMLFGGSTVETAQTSTQSGYSLNVVCGEHNWSVTVPEQDTNANVIRKISLPENALSGKKITSINFNDTPIVEYCANANTLMLYTNAINATGGTLTIVTAEDESAFCSPQLSKSTAVSNSNLIAVAKAVSGSQFGIVLYKGDTAPAISANEVLEDEDGTYVVLPALGKNAEGIYAVELENVASYFTGSYKVASYAYNSETSTYVISEALTIN